MPKLIQPSFAKGELAPALYGRVDTSIYHIGLKTARNATISTSGGAYNRAGLSFYGPVKDHTKPPRLRRFRFSASDAAILELGDQYMRVIKDDGYVLETGFTVTGITQANPAVVTTSASHGYSNGDEVFLSGVVGMTEVNTRRFVVANVTATTFELTHQVTGANIDATGYAAYTSGGSVAKVYEIATPWAHADLFKLKFTQSADVVTVAHQLYDVRRINRFGDTNWTITQPEFKPKTVPPSGIQVTAGTTGTVTYRYTVTALAVGTLEESIQGLNNTTEVITAVTQANPAVATSTAHPYVRGDEVEIDSIVGMTELNGRRFIVGDVTANTFELLNEDSTSHTAYVSGGTSARTFVEITNGAATANNTITWTEVAGADKYVIFKEENGIYGQVGETRALTFTDDNQAPDLTATPPQPRTPFEGTGNKPGAVGHYEQRQAYGGSINEPDTIHYTRIGQFDNLTISLPTQQDDAVTATLNDSQVNEIRHFVGTNDLIVLTSGAEWRVNSGSETAFAADTLKQKPQTRWGASHVEPLLIGDTILFVQELGSMVRSIGFSLQVDKYKGPDLSILASHLFRQFEITDWSLSLVPEGQIFAVRDDGQLLNLAFEQDQEVVAWTHWDTDGKFYSTDAIPTTEREEQPFFVVQRQVDGNTVYYVERLHSREFEEVHDAFFVDSGLSYNQPQSIEGISLANPVVVTITGHGYADGDEVDIFDVKWVPDFDDTFNETQPDQLNRRRFEVANSTANTFELKENGVFVDGTAYNAYIEGGTVRLAKNTFGGLWHLEGRECVALADGNVVTGLTVTNGTVTFARSYSRVHLGLRYISDIETLDIEVPNSATLQSRKKKVASVTTRFEKSRGLLVGPSSARLTEMKQREFEPYGEPTTLLTGDITTTLKPDWNSNGRIFYRQANPLPFGILAVIPDMQITT